jgi:hypothetical protein
MNSVLHFELPWKLPIVFYGWELSAPAIGWMISGYSYVVLPWNSCFWLEKAVDELIQQR